MSAREGERFDWTPEMEGRLRALWGQADPVLSTGVIAQMMRITKNAVVGKAHRLNLPARPSPIKTLRGAGGERKAPAPKRVKGPTLPPLPVLARTDVPVPVAAPARPVMVHEATPGSRRACCFPIGDPRVAGFRFCDAPVARPGGSYCEEHHAMCWMKRPERSEAQRSADEVRRVAMLRRHEERARLGLGWGWGG